MSDNYIYAGSTYTSVTTDATNFWIPSDGTTWKRTGYTIPALFSSWSDLEKASEKPLPTIKEI